MVYDPRGGGNVHIDRVLTNISVAWPNNGFVGEALFKPVPVTKQTDKYYVFGREAWQVHPGGDLRAPGGHTNEITGLSLSLDTYFAQEHALMVPVTPEEMENADAPLDPFRDGTELVTAKLLLVRELAQMTMVTTTANYAAGHSTTLAGGDQWNVYATSDPIDDFRVAFRTIHSKLFLEPNLAGIPYQVMTQLDHPDFIERIKYSERGVLTSEIIASILGVANVIVPGVGYNSAVAGQAESLGYLWGKDVVIAYVPERAGMRIPAFAYEYVWRYPGAGLQAAERWWDQNRRCWLIRVSRRYDLKMVAVDSSADSLAGYVIKAAVA